MKKILGLVVFLAAASLNAFADDITDPAPESAEKLQSDFDRSFLGSIVETIPSNDIIRNSSLKLKLRNYYLARTRPENTDPRAWAQGGSVEYKIDKLGGFFGFTAEYFGSFKLYGPDEHDGTLLLEAGQNNLDTLGVLTPRLSYGGQTLSAYRQKYDLPFVNSQDNRMIPNTFEGYTLAMPKSENEKFQYIIGYISEIKTRNNENFVSMSEAAGVSGKERGMIATGARYFILPELNIGAVNYFVDDVLNTAYAEGAHKIRINENVGNAFSVQFADQRSVGDDLLTGNDVSTNFWGIQNALSYKNATLKAAFTSDDTGATIRSPWGSYAGYNSSIFEDFNRAGEKAWQIGLLYNFARLGLKDLGISTAYVHGFDAVDDVTKEDIPNKDETDITIDYKVSDGMLKGLWVRLRSAFIDTEGLGTTEDFRIIVNYEIPLLEPEKSVEAGT